MMAINLAGHPGGEQHPAEGQRLAAAIRGEGHRNIEVLERIQEELVQRGVKRRLIRIFDAIRWYSNPAARILATQRMITVPGNGDTR